MPTITDADEGKDVVNTDDEQVGVVAEVRQGTAYVEPDPDLTDELKATLGMDNTDESAYALPDDRIGTVTDDEIRLRDDRKPSSES